MKNKISKAGSILSLCVIMLLILAFTVSSLPTITPVYAYTSSEGYTGKEDPEKVNDFDGSMMAMNKYKAWSIYRGMGMTYNQAIAAMACMQAESHFRSELIEGSDPLGLGGLGDTEDEAKDYIKNYSQLMDTNADFRTNCTDAIVGKMGISQSTIEKCHDGQASSIPRSERMTTFGSLSLSTYYDDAGVGWLGCGLYQFTGEALRKLFAWSDQTNTRWFEYETQFAYTIADSSSGGYKGEDLQAWMSASKDMALNECVETFFHAMINGNDLPDFVAKRQILAAQLYPEFVGVSWNQKYANKVLAMAGLKGVSTREGIQDRSVVYSYASTVVYYPKNNGFLLNVTENDKLVKRNKEVFTGYVNRINNNADTSNKYSLFELYGEDLHWYRYMGEATYTPTLMDHIWSAIDQNKTSELVSVDTIDYDAYNYLSCNVYPNRPTVLTKEDIVNGDRDPRVSALSTGWFDGYFYVSGSVKFTIAKYIIAITAYLMGPEIRETFMNVLNYLEGTEGWHIIKAPILAILGLAMIFFIFSLVKKSVNYAKGSAAARDLISRFLTGVLSLGLLFAVLAKPAVFNNVIDKSVNIIDTMFSSVLTAAVNQDEVINVTDEKLAIHAVLWRKAIFNPWVRGQFDNTDYKDLYTQYANVDKSHMMPQDNEETDTSDTTGKAFYNSAECTGDVSVPVGGGVELKNWAAYLYSCGTDYHIDSTLDAEAVENLDMSNGIIFPHYTTKTTANNPDINADLFRVIDAQMNISPQNYASGSTNNNYMRAHTLKPHYEYQSLIALFNSLLVLFMFPVIFKKLLSFMMLMITTVKMIYFTILEIFKENTGMSPFLESVKKDFIDYIIACIKLNLMVTLYYIFVDKGFIELVIYMALCIVILGFTWKDVRHTVQDTKYAIQRIKRHI